MLAKNVMLTLVFYLNSHFRKIADVNQNMIQKNHFDMMYSTFHFFPIMLSLSPMHKFFKSHLWCLAFHNHEVYCDACDVLQVTCIILDQFFKARGGGAYIMNIKSVFKDPPSPNLCFYWEKFEDEIIILSSLASHLLLILLLG